MADNRHYWATYIARNNIISIVNHTDYDAFAVVLERFGIVVARLSTFQCPTLCALGGDRVRRGDLT